MKTNNQRYFYHSQIECLCGGVVVVVPSAFRNDEANINSLSRRRARVMENQIYLILHPI